MNHQAVTCFCMNIGYATITWSLRSQFNWESIGYPQFFRYRKDRIVGNLYPHPIEKSHEKSCHPHFLLFQLPLSWDKAGDFSRRSWDSASQASQACRWSLCLCRSPSRRHRGTSLAHVWPRGLGPEWFAPGWGLGADIADMTVISFICRHVRYARLHWDAMLFHIPSGYLT